jgi:hypothetical protein
MLMKQSYSSYAQTFRSRTAETSHFHTGNNRVTTSAEDV